MTSGLETVTVVSSDWKGNVTFNLTVTFSKISSIALLMPYGWTAVSMSVTTFPIILAETGNRGPYSWKSERLNAAIKGTESKIPSSYGPP